MPNTWPEKQYRTVKTKYMDLFERTIGELQAGDQFKQTEDGQIFEVFSADKNSVRYLRAEQELYHEDGTMSRNMLFRFRFMMFHEKVILMPNKIEVLNRNHREYGHPETWLGGTKKYKGFDI